MEVPMTQRPEVVTPLLVSLLVSCTGSIGYQEAADQPPGPGGSGGGPGRSSPDTRLRRLTRTEYSNTLRDLLGDDISQHGNRLPADHPYVNGIFDNDAETLSSNALDVETYETVATDAVEDA